MFYDAQLAATCLYSRPLFGGRFWLAMYRPHWVSFWWAIRVLSTCACKITSLCVQRLRFVPPWLMHIHTRARAHRVSICWHMKSSAMQLSQKNYRFIATSKAHRWMTHTACIKQQKINFITSRAVDIGLIRSSYYIHGPSGYFTYNCGEAPYMH